MRVRWTNAALRHLREAYEYVEADKPSAAERMANLIEGAIHRLRLFPHMGKRSRRPKTYELPVADTPFVVIYRVRSGILEILAIYHGAQNWKNLL